MIEEVVDIALANQWEINVFEESFPNDTFTVDTHNDSIYGICFSPPQCEVVCLTFLSNGKICAFYKLGHASFSQDELDDDSQSVKTQFAGPKIHIQLIEIFDYLNKKYFENFDLTDEGNYWETKNEQLLIDTFKKYTNLIEGFDSLLENIPMGESEAIEDYLIRIAEIVHRKNSRNSSDNIN
jgi:hypothetical protein